MSLSIPQYDMITETHQMVGLERMLDYRGLAGQAGAYLMHPH